MAGQTLGQVIHEIRLNHGLTQDRFAKVAGVSGRSVVSYWETNKARPNPQAMKHIADLEGITVSELLQRVSETALN